MTDLSPAARAVLTAVTLKKYDVPPEGLPAFAEEMAPLIATALRATADELIPPVAFNRRHTTEERWDARDDIRFELLAIAAELEGTDG